MRRVATLAAFVAAVILSMGAVLAHDGHNHAAGDAPASGTNKFCPVMGKDSPVDAKVRAEYEGQYVYFCCAGCEKKFAADPKAVVAKLSAEDQAAIKPNDTCPTSGEKIENHDVKVEHNGRLVYFCCAGCTAPYMKKHGIAAD